MALIIEILSKTPCEHNCLEMKLKEFLIAFEKAGYSGRKKAIIHCVFWLFWLGFIWLYTPNNFRLNEDIFELDILIALRDWGLSILFFYVASKYVFSQLSENKFFVPILTIVLFYFFIYTVSYYSLIYFSSLFPSQTTLKGYIKYVTEHGFWKGIYARFNFWFITFWYALYIVVPLIIKLLIDVAYIKVKNLELQRNNIRLELDYLKAQLNPHFFFNTLNGIYSLVIDSEPKAAQIILKLSDLMRYSLYEANNDQVALHREIKFIKDYVELERNRHKASTQIMLEIEGTTNDLHIPPLLLVTFVENAFKHGINNTIKASWIKIVLSVNEDTLTFIVSNSKPKNIKHETVQGGIGLWNVRKRLDILYPNRHKLEIQNFEEIYIVNLSILLDKYNSSKKSAATSNID